MSADDGNATQQDSGAAIVDDAADTAKLAVGALTSQADLDKLLATRFASVPLAILSRRTDWNGLTPTQEKEQQQNLLQQAHAKAEYEQEMAATRERADRLMEQLDEQEEECRRKLAEADSRAIVLADGRRVLVGEHGGYVDKATGDALKGEDKTEAQRQRKPDSETAAERNDLIDRLKKIDEAKENVRDARRLASEDGGNLSADEMQKNESTARNKLDEAEAMAGDVENREKHLAADATALSETDTLSALGIGATANARTTSFAATIDGKDSRSTALHDKFSACAEGAGDNASTLNAPGPGPSNPVVRKPSPQQSQ